MFFDRINSRDAVVYLYRGVVTIVLGLGLLGPLVFGILFKWHHAPEFVFNPHIPRLAGAVAVFCAVLPFLLIAMIARRRAEPSRTLLVFVFLGVFLSRAAFAAVIDNQLISDYATMWDFVQRFLAAPEFTPADSIQQMRTFPFYLPATFLLGTGKWAYQFANVVAETLITLLIFLISARIAGRRAGTIAAVLFAFAPEPLFAAEILTHDIPGTLYALAAIYLAMIVLGRQVRQGPAGVLYPMLISVLLGVTLVLLDVQRNIAIAMFVALFLSGVGVVLFQGLRAPKMMPQWDGGVPVGSVRSPYVTLLLVFFLPLAVFQAGSAAVDRFLADVEFRAADAGVRRPSITMHAHTGSFGAYADGVEIYPYLALLTPSGGTALLSSRSLTDLRRNLARWPQTYTEKTMRLYNIGRQGGEYFGFPAGTGVSARWDQAAVAGVLYLYTLVYAMLFLMVSAVVVLWLMLSCAVSPAGLPAALFVAVLTILLGLFGEIQSRYIFPLWGVMPIYVGIFLSAGRLRVPQAQMVLRSIGGAGIVAAMGAAVGAVAFGVFYGSYGYDAGRIIVADDWNGGSPIETRTMSGVRLSPGSSASAQTRAVLPVASDRDLVLSFFVVSEAASGAPCTWNAMLDLGTDRWIGTVLLEPKRPALIELSGLAQGRSAGIRLGMDTTATSTEAAPQCAAVDLLFPRFVAGGRALADQGDQRVRVLGAPSTLSRVPALH